MASIAIGILAFAGFVACDYGGLKHPHRAWNGGFLLCSAALAYAVAALTPWGELRMRSTVFLITHAVLAGICAWLLVYAVFFAVKPSGDAPLSLNDTGVYALCRHPGVLFMGMLLGVWALASRSAEVFCAAAVFTLCDVLYVLWQDYYLFPKTIAKYDEYRTYTPFLIPTAASIRRMINQ